MTSRQAEPDDQIHTALKAAIEVETTGHLWGQPSTFVPAVCSKVFGDGRALLALTTCNSRPAYYVIRIDSAWNVEDFHAPRDAPDVREFIDEIGETLNDEFGDGTTRYDEDEDEEEQRDWPAFDGENGCSWGRMDWPAGIPAELDPHPFARCNVLSDFRIPTAP